MIITLKKSDDDLAIFRETIDFYKANIRDLFELIKITQSKVLMMDSSTEYQRDEKNILLTQVKEWSKDVFTIMIELIKK